ncbi:hypothetical protein D3C75_257230 [compost metagenome]
MARGYPVDRSFDLPAAHRAAAPRLRITGAAQLADLPGYRVLDHFIAFDDVRTLQAYFTARNQPPEARYRLLHKVSAFNVENAAEGNLSCSQLCILTIVIQTQQLSLRSGIVGDHYLERFKHSHHGWHTGLQILSQHVLQQRKVHH